MDNSYTFLELPLDRDLYKPKKVFDYEKPPLRVLITEAGSRIARHLMYKICSGAVFGPNQPIILHLVNAKGCISHKATILDLEQCSFPLMADTVVTSEPQNSYGNVDVIVMIALFEEISGHSSNAAFLNQINKTKNVAKNIVTYAKKDAKLIVCSPSTKGVMVLLTCIKLFEPRLNPTHVSGVVAMDVTIATSLVAKQLKTTTNNIKNVTIWGATSPDLRNATVFTYHPDDKGNFEKMELPVMRVLQDQKWIYTDFIPEIYGRIMGPGLMNHGTAVASATAKHLQVLFHGAESDEEIVSMGVIVPKEGPYGLTEGIGFSLPVVAKDGNVTIRENVHSDIHTKIANIKFESMYRHDPSFKGLYDVIKFINEYEDQSVRDFIWKQHTSLAEKSNLMGPFMKYIISPGSDETSHGDDKDIASKKSITWDEVHVLEKSTHKNVKSVLRFNLQKSNLQ